RQPTLGDEVNHVAGLGRRNRRGEWRQDRDRYLDALLRAAGLLLGLGGDYAGAGGLLAPPPGVAAAAPSVGGQVVGEPLLCAQRPVGFVAVQLLLRPSVEAVRVVLACEELDALGRVDGDQLFLDRPAEKPAHPLQEIVGRMWSFGAALAIGPDRLL